MVIDGEGNPNRRSSKSANQEGKITALRNLKSAISDLSGVQASGKIDRARISMRNECLIKYDGNFKTFWDILNSFLVFYIFLVLPIRIAFS